MNFTAIKNRHLFRKCSTELLVLVFSKRLRHSHLNNVIFSYLNINSIRNKLCDLDKVADGNIDILRIAETKLRESFPNNQFVLVRYHLPYRLDITDKKSDLMVFVKSYIPSIKSLMILKFHVIYK